jgi:DNA-binding LacI/PurR family transcriptional regulator
MAGTKRQATMRDIAKHAGVSQTAVSFVINGPLVERAWIGRA